YRLLASKVPYPLHLGVTEAGTPYAGSIKSAVGMGALLVDGIGDTIRVSLTADPVEEVKTAFEILKALGLRERGPIMIACPSCGRDNVGVQQLAERVEERLRTYPEAFEVAVLGCAVNGPGEAGDADFGIAGGRRGGEPQAARPRRVHPAGHRRRVDLPAARLAGPPEDRADHPRGDGRDRRPGDAHAGAYSRGALGDDRPDQDPRDIPPARP